MIKEAVFIVGGERWSIKDDRCQVIRLPSGGKIKLPIFDDIVASKLLSSPRGFLCDTPMLLGRGGKVRSIHVGEPMLEI